MKRQMIEQQFGEQTQEVSPETVSPATEEPEEVPEMSATADEPVPTPDTPQKSTESEVSAPETTSAATVVPAGRKSVAMPQ